MLDIPHCVGGVRAFQTACVMPFDICNWASTVSLDVSPCPFLSGVACDRLWWSNSNGHLISLLLFSLLICNVHHCPICFLLFNFSLHSINLLFHFVFIYRNFYSIQFSPSIAISHMFGLSFWLSFFKFSNFVISTFIEVFFFQFHHSINFFIIDFFQFHHSFISTVLQFN